MDPPFFFHRATPSGEGGVCVFEVYGAGGEAAIARVFRPRRGRLPDEGRTRLGEFSEPAREPIDEGVACLVPADGMWSRLPAWTLSLHGGAWIQEKAASVFSGLGGRELDTRGVLGLALREGSLDAVQAAAYELLLASRTERAARFFARQYGGELSSEVRRGWRLAGEGEADEARDVARRLLSGSPAALRMSAPLRVLIAGRPNAGKSTLFNNLLGAEQAAVSRIPGTTRDLLEGWTSMSGYPVLLLDGAGIRPLEGVGRIEREGIRRVEAESPDLTLFLVPHPWSLEDEDRRFLARTEPSTRILVASLSDLARPGVEAHGCEIAVSARSGDGIAALRQRILERAVGARAVGDEDLPCAAFTSSQFELLSRGAADPSLDSLRRCFIECLESSWPVNPKE